MRIGDLVRYREVTHYTKPVSYTKWILGVLLDKRHNVCDVLTTGGEKISLWSSLVQKAGKKDAKR